MLLFCVISLVVCMATHLNLKKDKPQLNTLKTLEIINWIAMIFLCVSDVFSLLTVPTLFVLAIILIIPTIAIAIWHFKLIKKIKNMQKQSIIYCNNCGTALSNELEFCTVCGERLEDR